MFERLRDSRSAGVLVVAGGFHDEETARDERLQAQLLAGTNYRKYYFVISSVVDKPNHCLKDKERVIRLLVMDGLSRGINHNGFERTVLFGDFMTEFMRLVVNESKRMRIPLEFRARKGSLLERYGKWFERSRRTAEAAFAASESLGIRIPG